MESHELTTSTITVTITTIITTTTTITTGPTTAAATTTTTTRPVSTFCHIPHTHAVVVLLVTLSGKSAFALIMELR
ncbi:hypothetical protein E2C01_081592 [Portunus trituberculatus]|uniref:Uncharacterized protein n=1 Tax=Portunus trituberculatus TaxID=210409 RepID=A0A5B7IYK0_PORTR|nr:hypothetical protein [Portunus trituberculatus]